MSEANTAVQLSASRARLTLTGDRELLSSGMSEVVRVAFTFSPDWDGLHKIAVFSNGSHSVDVPEADWQEDVCTIPAQVLSEPGKTLMVGVYGADGAHLVLPTVWCVLGRIEPGAEPAFLEAAPPEPSAWASLQAQLDEAKAAMPLMIHGEAEEDDFRVDAAFEQIAEAAGEGRMILLELSGSYLQLCRLLPGVSAEFVGTVFEWEGSSCYSRCIVTPSGAALETVAIAAAANGQGTAAAPETFLVTVSHDADSTLQADATTAQLLAAYAEGKQLRLLDLMGRQLLPEQIGADFVVFTGLSWFMAEETFCFVSYVFGKNGLRQHVLTVNETFYTKSRIDQALGDYITELARLVGGDA